MKVASYTQAINYLEGFIGKVIFKIPAKQDSDSYDPLERMRVLLNLLDNPQDKFKSILVGGTSGKGSTSYLISHILKKTGYKTGLTISPHLQRVNERLQINGQNISDEKFVEILNLVIPAIEKMSKMKVGEPSYFEILIGMAFKYFADQKVDIAVVEVGMGGEFDATNTLYPLVAVLTNVSLDHTNILGKTVEEIARTKTGIIKLAGPAARSSQGAPSSLASARLGSLSLASPANLIVISGVRQPSVVKIVEDRCREVGAKLYRLGKDFDLTKLSLSLKGDYQKENASLAIEVVRRLADFGFKVSEKDITSALKTAFFPGRFEVLRLPSVAQDKMKLTFILDGAHNAAKMEAFLSSLTKLFPKERKIFIVAFKNDKDIKGMLRQITKVADNIIATEFKVKTDMKVFASTDANSIKYKVLSIKYKGRIDVEKDSKKALQIGLKTIQQFSNLPANALHRQVQASPAILVVTGSLYLVGEIRNYLFKK